MVLSKINMGKQVLIPFIKSDDDRKVRMLFGYDASIVTKFSIFLNKKSIYSDRNAIKTIVHSIL
jgi:hypothetical protein